MSNIQPKYGDWLSKGFNLEIGLESVVVKLV